MSDLVKFVATLPKEKQDAVTQQFNALLEFIDPIVKKAATLVVTDASQTDLMKQARQSRLILKSKRTEVESMRKQLKEQSLRESTAIDAVARFLRELIEPAEKHLEQQEKFVEIQEEKFKEELRKRRSEELKEYVSDCALFDLGSMSEEQYQSILEGQKAAHNQRLAAAAKEEEERIAKQKELDDLRKLAAAKKAEDDAREAEAKAQEKAAKKAASAPDKVKLAAFSKAIGQLADTAPEVKSEEAKKIISDVQGLLRKTIKYLDEKTETL